MDSCLRSINLEITNLCIKPRQVPIPELARSLHISYNWFCLPFSGDEIVCLISGGRNFVFASNKQKIIDHDLNIPKNTILIGSFCNEVKGESKAQRKMKAFHVIDAIVLNGAPIYDLAYGSRVEKITKFCLAIDMKTQNKFTKIQPPKFQESEFVSKILENVNWLVMKNARGFRPCIRMEDSEYFAILSGIIFIRVLDFGWTMAYSKNSKKKYYFNTKSNESSYESKTNMFLHSNKAMHEIYKLDIETTNQNDFEELKRTLKTNFSRITPHLQLRREKQ